MSAPLTFQSFKDLVTAEHRQIEEAKAAAKNMEPNPDMTAPFTGTVRGEGNTGEPWVVWSESDRVGLALSGGGIRSATFNLGLLEALAQRGVLEHVDYLSTVSGGGYVGGFWTAWRQRSTEAAPGGTALVFPVSQQAETRDRAERRHLREFSRFLMPRIGLNQPEMWTALAAVLGGMVPALLATFATLVLGVYAWLALGWLALRAPTLISKTNLPLQTALVFLALTAGLHAWREWMWKRERLMEAGAQTHWFARLRTGFFALGTVGFGALMMAALAQRPPADSAWGWIRPGHFHTITYELPVAWLCLAVLVPFGCFCFEPAMRAFESLLAGRDPETLRQCRMRRTMLRDQFAARYLAWSAVSGLVAGVWELGCRLDAFAVPTTTGTAGGLTAVFTGLFVWARRWLEKSGAQAAESGWWKKLALLLKRRLPMLAASAGVASMAVFTVLLVRHWGLGWNDAKGTVPADAAGVWQAALYIILTAGAVCVWALSAFDPAYFGLHDFYRSRIARAFLGAAFTPGPQWQADHVANAALVQRIDEQVKNAPPGQTKEAGIELSARLSAGLADAPGAQDNRFTIERAEDDLVLGQLPATLDDVRAKEPALTRPLAALRLRPVHLICCAANNLSGDALHSLSRGARSTVLSQRGVAIGSDACAQPHLTLSAAQTASAAAFNSQMGAKSLLLGPAGAFLMSAFNLRLGLWVRNPASVRTMRDLEVRRALGDPDAALRHAWGEILLDHIGSYPGSAFFTELFGLSRCNPSDTAQRLHLSDGGHFENLGLYELIRRHCRYLIVSDSGQDESVVFDDLANAIRRVREDFGVEIELDLDPIRPGKHKLARQHLAVGTIHYDGYAGSDKGTLLYFKPVLTGDESRDLQQYRERNRAFPHESTADQFFDEAQWESYRRLGEHSGQAAFAFLDRLTPEQHTQSETIFWCARSAWSALPPGFHERFIRLTARVQELDTDIRSHAPAALKAELFPELPPPAALMTELFPELPPPTAIQQSDEATVAFFLMRVLQLMEDVWLTLELDRLWSHPMNDGWMNYFDRWASTPSFRRLWLLLCPLYSIEFREFVKTRYGLRPRDPIIRAADQAGDGPVLELRFDVGTAAIQAGHAWKTLLLRRPAPVLEGASVLEYLLPLSPPAKLQVGLVPVRIEIIERRRIARWSSAEFYVPESLSGAGIVGRFLERIVFHLKTTEEVAEIRVALDDETKGRRDPASRQLRLRQLDFYRSRQFTLHRAADGLSDEMRQSFPA